MWKIRRWFWDVSGKPAKSSGTSCSSKSKECKVYVGWGIAEVWALEHHVIENPKPCMAFTQTFFVISMSRLYILTIAHWLWAGLLSDSFGF
jgi:hypothetical protein